MKQYVFLLLAFLLLSSCSKEDAVSFDSGIRVVSLAPNLTEIVFAIGADDRLVGRTSACNYPESVQTIKTVGGFGAPSIEMLMAIKPDFILEVDLEDEAVGQKLDSVGLRRVRIECAVLDDIPSAIRQVGELLGAQERAETLANEIASEVRLYKEAAIFVVNRPKVYVEIWSDPIFTAGKNSFVSQVIWLAGGTNIADSIEKPYFSASEEWVIAQNPDIIFCAYTHDETSGGNSVAKRKGWGSVNAVKNDCIYSDINTDIYLRPGPRVLEGLRAFKKKMSEAQTESR